MNAHEVLDRVYDGVRKVLKVDATVTGGKVLTKTIIPTTTINPGQTVSLDDLFDVSWASFYSIVVGSVGDKKVDCRVDFYGDTTWAQYTGYKTFDDGTVAAPNRTTSGDLCGGAIDIVVTNREAIPIQVLVDIYLRA